MRRLQREQEPKSPFVFTSERGSPFTTAGFAPNEPARWPSWPSNEGTMLRVFLIVLVLFATPAMAGQKIFLSCTNGRDPQTNVAVSDPNLSLIVEPKQKG
jgi:hypothetical protein